MEESKKTCSIIKINRLKSHDSMLSKTENATHLLTCFKNVLVEQ